MSKVLIASLDNWDSCAEVPSIFKKAGFNVDVYCGKGFWLKTNKFHDQWIESSNEIETYINDLLNLIDHGDYKLIILTDEPLLKNLNERIEDPEVFKKVMPLLKVENRKMLSSKRGFSEFCISNNIDTPRYETYDSPDDYEKIVSNLKFPLINKNEFSWGGSDMCITNSENDLKELLKGLEIKQSILFQEYIDGDEIRIDAYYYKGELVIYFCAKVLTYAQNRFSYNTRRTYYNNPEIKEILIELGRKSGANGFANINYIQEKKSGIFYLIEMDLRTNSWLAYSQYLSHTNFISSFKNILNDVKQSEPNAILKKENIEIGLFYKDIKRAYWQKDLRGILRWIFNIHGYWRFLPFYDLTLSKRIFKLLFYEFVTHRIQTAIFKK